MSGKEYVVGGPTGTSSELLVTGRWTEEAAEQFRIGRVDRLVLNRNLGFSEDDLTFLRDIPIRELVLVDRNLASLAPIYEISSTLEELDLVVGPSAGRVDVAEFPRLTKLSADWETIGESVSSATTLTSLQLRRYRRDDLVVLAGLTNLRRLALADRPRVRSLGGIENMALLREFEVPAARLLTDAQMLSACRNLVRLSLEGCARLDLSFIGTLGRLRWMNISECGDVSDVRFLANLHDLEVLRMFGSTRVVDGDLTPIAELPRLKELRMQSRRHYRPTVSEIQVSLSDN